MLVKLVALARRWRGRRKVVESNGPWTLVLYENLGLHNKKSCYSI